VKRAKSPAKPPVNMGFGSPLEMALRCLETNRKPRRGLVLSYRPCGRGIEMWFSGDFMPSRNGQPLRMVDETELRRLHGYLSGIVRTLDDMKAEPKGC